MTLHVLPSSFPLPRRARPARAAGAASLLALALALAGPAQAIVGGTSTSAFPAVGTGVQVTPDWVVTVQHAALNVGDTYSNGYGLRQVVGRFDAPGSGSFPANDLTLLRLSPTAASIPSLLVAADTFAEGTLPAFAVTITSPLNTQPDGQPRSYGFTRISEFARQIDDGNGNQVTVNYLISYDTAVRVQGGDSGGGLFFGHVTNSTSPLLGLSSALLEDENQPPNPIGSGFVQLSAYRSWIDTTMAANGAQSIQWVTAVPEPAAWALWAGGLLAVGAAARRRA